MNQLEEARDLSHRIGSAAVVIVHNGIIVDEWGQVTRKFNVHSIRKSFLFSLYGIYEKEKQIDLDNTLGDLRIDDKSPLTETEKKARIVDLLRSRSGVYHRAAYQTPKAKASRPPRGSARPGQKYYYNNWDFNALLTIFEQETGTRIFEAFHERIAVPIEMEHFQVSDGYYHIESSNSIHPAYPFRMSALDMARFGLLYLREGQWRTHHLIPKEWIEKAITPYTIQSGYGIGFKWVKIIHGELSQYGTYYTSGYGGHRIFILPQLNTVVVHRVNTDLPWTNVTQEEIEELLIKIVKAVPTH